MNALLDVRVITTILGITLALVRIVYGVVVIARKLRDNKIFELSAAIDPHGRVQVIVKNQTSSSFAIDSVQMVRERSMFRQFLRLHVVKGSRSILR